MQGFREYKPLEMMQIIGEYDEHRSQENLDHVHNKFQQSMKKQSSIWDDF